MKYFITTMAAAALLFAQSASAEFAVDAMLKIYRDAGAGPFSAQAGESLWTKKYRHDTEPAERACSSCHTSNLSQTGKHVKTLKPIKPMAPSANAERLTDTREIDKWFKRNCMWTLGRECTAQEKGDFLLYIQQ